MYLVLERGLEAGFRTEMCFASKFLAKSRVILDLFPIFCTRCRNGVEDTIGIPLLTQLKQRRVDRAPESVLPVGLVGISLTTWLVNRRPTMT